MLIALTKVRSLFKDSKQTAGCTEFRTETGLHSLVSIQKFVHPAACLPSLKRERTLRSILLFSSIMIIASHGKKEVVV